MKNYISPSFQSSLFNCPHSDCLVPARHSWEIIRPSDQKSFYSKVRDSRRGDSYPEKINENDIAKKYIWQYKKGLVLRQSHCPSGFNKNR